MKKLSLEKRVELMGKLADSFLTRNESADIDHAHIALIADLASDKTEIDSDMMYMIRGRLA